MFESGRGGGGAGFGLCAVCAESQPVPRILIRGPALL
jgi:hypothetical protein